MNDWKVIGVHWRSSLETTGFVLVHSSDGMLRAYVGRARSGSDDADAHWIAEHGARLLYREAVAFFPTIKAEEYAEYGV